MTQAIRTALIVGAGPVGLTLAGELARYGIGVRIIDKALSRTDKSKALVVWSRTLELLDRAGEAGPFLDTGLTVGQGRMWSGSQRIATIGFEDVASPFPFALMIPQSETERLLEEALARRGVAVERATELLAFEAQAEAVNARLRGPSGEETVSADWLIGCDGAHSVVRHGLGLEFAGSTQLSDWALADVLIEGYEPGHIDIFWHASGMLALFPVGRERYRVIADLGPAQGTGPRREPTLDEVQAIVDTRGPGGLRLHDPIWLSAFRINERKVKDYGRGRVFLAGDAAHIHSPAGGQGMNTGMQDAFNLAWKLALVGKGRAAPSLLDSYSVERSAVGDRVLRNASAVTDLAVLRNPVAQVVRNVVGRIVLGLPQVRHKLSDTFTELDIAYPDSPLSVAAAGAPHGHDAPRAGARWPLDRAAPIRFGAGSEPRFTVLGPAALAADLSAAMPDLVEARTLPEGIPQGLWIVRPDGYVGLAAPAGARAGAEVYLEALRRAPA